MTLANAVCWAVIPVKAAETAKQRLAPALDSESRQRLVSAMLRKVVAAAQAAKHVDWTALIGPGRHGLHQDVPLLAEPEGGLNAALTSARDAAVAQGVTRIVVLPGDLPHLTSQEVDILACAPSGSVAVAPDRHGTGTNALSLPLPAAANFRFQFGPDSFALHAREAQRLGLAVETVHSAGLARDIDTPDDLADATGLWED